MPRNITKPIVIHGHSSDEEIQSLSIFTDQDEMIVAYVESCFLNKQSILDSILTLGMKCYIQLKDFLEFHHDSELIATGLIYALEACNYHEAVRWIEESYPRSTRIDYKNLIQCREIVKYLSLKLEMFDRHITKLDMWLSDSISKNKVEIPNCESVKSINELTPLDRYIEIVISGWNEVENVDGIISAVNDADYDWLYKFMQNIVEPELTDPEAKALTDDPEVGKFRESVATGELSYVDFCSRYGLNHPNQVALAKFIDENGY